jgi:hypothetical protein
MTIDVTDNIMSAPLTPELHHERIAYPQQRTAAGLVPRGGGSRIRFRLNLLIPTNMIFVTPY